MQRSVIAIPKSVHKSRMEENFAIWDFRLSDEDMQAIPGLDMMQKIADLTNPELFKALHNLKIHD